ncbi:MAG: acyltransferase family protein [Candidatus Cryptobacteroides sp.]
MENNTIQTKMAVKPHYALLDGLRGVAALSVICYHVFEGFATSPIDQRFNHGYLAVDFFFILSGFVMGYAYDDRWNIMTVKDFFKRRLIRLHPMVIFGSVLGAVTFLIQGSVQWDGTAVPFTSVLLSLLLGMLMIPAVPGTAPEVRGNGEMFPLNGPSWSLFFEYIGNILYAFFLHRLSDRWLKVFVVTCGISLACFAIFNGSGCWNIGVGWTLADNNLIGGFLRMSFSFSAGLLISRHFQPKKIKGAFWICSAMIVALLAVPYIGSEKLPWLNGVYDIFCTSAAFPLILWICASGQTEHKASERICKFLGDISFPVYIVHYPLMYLFYSWVWNNGASFSQALPVALCVCLASVLIAWGAMKLYDAPVRKWLTSKF